MHKSLVASGSVILIGRPGSGKSTAYHTLETALNNLHNKEVENATEKRTEKPFEPVAHTSSEAPKTQGSESKEDRNRSWPRIETTVIFPKALTSQEVIGLIKYFVSCFFV